MLLFGLLIFCLIVISLSTNEHYGLDDWKQENIEKYIEDNTGIDIDPNTLTALGLHDGGDFVEKMSSDSVNTLIKDPKKREKLLSAYGNLMTHKKNNPVDVFEWRIINRKLCDFWIVPLLISQPRVLLFWARYFDKDPLIEKINNEIDEIPAWKFWSYTIFCPQVLIAQIAIKFNSTATIDDYIKYFLLVAAIAEVCILLRFLYLLYLFCVVISEYMGSKALVGVLFAPVIVLYLIFNSKPLLEEVKREFPHFELLFYKIPIVFGFYTVIGYYFLFEVLPPAVEDYVAYFFFYVGAPISLILSSVAINRQFDDMIRVNRLKEKIIEAMPKFINALKPKSD